MFRTGKIADKMKMMLVLLLILLKEAGPTAAHSCSCSWWCNCVSRGLTSVPQDLPTDITELDLWSNNVTTLSQSDFSRYSSLTKLYLNSNQISVINSGAFYNLSRLTELYLYNNQLTSLRSDMFVGLDSLQYLWLDNNNINSISAGALENLRALQNIDLSHNNISTVPVEALSHANTSAARSTLTLNNNQMETLSSEAYDLLSSFSDVNINNNPWLCDCGMLPVKQRMTETLGFEQQITCAGPEHLAGKSLLFEVDAEDLNCEDTGTGSTGSTSTAPAQSFSLSAFLGGLGVIVGSFLISAICLPTWHGAFLDGRTQKTPDEFVTHIFRTGKIADKMKMMLVLLLILLKKAGPTAACSSSCSSYCYCGWRGLTSVPQDLPTDITVLDLGTNAITTLSQSDFSRYSSLTELYLQHNQISVINSGAFYNLSRLTTLTLHYNRLTSLRSDMFVGLDSLQYLVLDNNNINSISAGALENLRALQNIDLSHNNISTVPVEALSHANTSAAWSTLTLNNNQMETLSSEAYDLLSSFSYVNINNNPWLCDCGMLPVKQRMTETLGFEQQITCAGPEHLAGKSLLFEVDAEDLNCEDTGTGSTGSTSTAPAQSFSLSAFLGGLGVIVGSFLISGICLPTWHGVRDGRTQKTPDEFVTHIFRTGKIADKMKMMLVLLLILLKEAGPTAAHSCSCSWWCNCVSRGLTSVPQDLPTDIYELDLWSNNITALNQSDFSRYSSLTELNLHSNQISVINSGAFYRLSRLTRLRLHNNQLTSLRSDMFVGLDNLRYLYLYHNNIHSIETGTFNATPQVSTLALRYNQLTSLRSDMFVGLDSLQYLFLDNNNINSISAGALENLRALQNIDLSHNNISTIPVEALSHANTPAAWSKLTLNNNQMETLPSEAYDLLSSFSEVDIYNNPWLCDCGMLPVKQRMNGTLGFEQQIICAGPEHLVGESLLFEVDAEDLNCEDTGTGSTVSTSTTPAQSFSLSAFLSGGLGVIVGSFLISGICLPTWHGMKMMLVFLLILLAEAGPTAACSSSCSSTWCSCDGRGLSSVPQDLPTTITSLSLHNNVITTLSQSDFSRYGSLTSLSLNSNQISVINSGAFYNLSRLTALDLQYNQLTSLRSDMFVGLDNLRYLYLHYNNIHSIEAGAFNATPQLQQLNLHNNQLTVFDLTCLWDLII
ncbi:uncharacterized protein LOC144907102 [Branchiostoma floridae x Branchiostoma belcheri]